MEKMKKMENHPLFKDFMAICWGKIWHFTKLAVILQVAICTNKK